MINWAEDLLTGIGASTCERDVFRHLGEASSALGFEYCAYGLRTAMPFSKPKIFIMNNYPVQWQARYQEADYIKIDPTVAHCKRSQVPIVWSDQVFAGSQALWQESRSMGLRVGWAQSSLHASGDGGMLTLVRSRGELTSGDLQANELRLHWLVNIAHLSIARIVGPRLASQTDNRLTHREVEVLKWTADGKTSPEVATILSISVDTVNFHVKNAVAKLNVCNKTAAVVRAAMMGMLS